MRRRGRKRASSPAAKPETTKQNGSDTGKIVHGVALAAFVALVVATPLIPSEAAARHGTGAPLVTLWLLLLLAWLAASALLKRVSLRLDLIDGAMLLLIGLHTISALVMASSGHARPTINMMWQWIAFGICFFLARQLVRFSGESRAMCAVMISLAVCLAMHSFYQYFYALPQARANYQANPEVELRGAGIDPAPGTPERKLFEDRLQGTEPTATFALTNSLAGFLAPWLICTVAIAGMSLRAPSPRRSSILVATLCAAAIGFCIVLTKSRTALLAVALGLCLLGLLRWRRVDWRFVAAALALFVLMIAGAAVAGGFDWLVLSEAPKSVLYRLEYWQATVTMVADHPWFGCGPGNFQEAYTRYKLPQASESIADPHNFLFEVWATAGTPALIVLVGLLGLVGYRVWRLAACGPDTRSVGDKLQHAQPRTTPAAKTDEDDACDPRWLYVGGIAGILLAFPCGLVVGYMPDPLLLLVGLPTGIVCCWLLDDWVRRGDLPAQVLAISLAVLLTNLLAAGGIGFAGIAQTVWILMALLLMQLPTGRGWTMRSPRIAITLAGMVFVLLWCCLWTFYQPVLTQRSYIAQGAEWQHEGYVERALESYRQAAAADPYSAEPWLHLASLYRHAALASGPRFSTEAFDLAVSEAVTRQPNSQSMWSQLGNWRLDLFRAGNNRRQLHEAIKAYSTAVRLYPNSGLRHAQLAWAYHIADDSKPAAIQAEEALRLDALHPHLERKLSRQRVHDPAAEQTRSENAEQLMLRLRR